ncbi:MAG: hypothetical protein J0I06_10715 [Planctomycetes bacterium]|nr:hypothetical protein [Planctomycetota bacterium]
MRFALSLAAALALAPAALAQDAFPRRVLFVHIADYVYLDPLTHAAPGGPDRVRDSAARLAAGLRVPTLAGNDQLFVLSDTAAPDAPLPTKDVLTKALGAFCDTTREQDRVVIYFGAHAVEKGGKAFVAPIDGELDAPASLVPVADVYARLKVLKAAQVVVIWDVCRHNADRVRGRRGTGPMTPELLKALTAVPEGVQVLVSCSPGERAAEYSAPRPATLFAGSAYLDALRLAAADDRAANPKARPGDAIPIESLHAAAAKAVAGVAKATGTPQTPVLRGTAPKRAAGFDPKEKPARRFEFSGPVAGASVARAKEIFAELALPPLLDGDAEDPLARLPFAEEALRDHASDVSIDDVLKNAEQYPLRVATLRALQTVRDVWPLGGKEQRGVSTLTAPVTDRAKKATAEAQVPVAKALARLELELTNLETVSSKRDNETKRWRAHYDFALAEVRLRAVVLNEYNRALGHVRTETLPDLDGGTGWRLVPSVKVEGRKDIRDLFAAADAGFARLAADHKGTPWEVLAKRSRAGLPGTRWEAIAPPRSDGK